MHFDLVVVDRLLKHSRQAHDHRVPYGSPDLYPNTQRPGLWLVGDNGVYLISNGLPRLLVDPDDKSEDAKSVVCYARECNPTTMHFNEWWTAKNASWGGSDGIIFFGLEEIEGALTTYPLDAPLELEVNQEGVGIYEWRNAPGLKKNPKKRTTKAK